MTTEELESLVKKHVSELGEHCTSVKIFVTAENPDDAQTTRSYSNGCGNWFTSYGQIHAWLVAEDEIIRNDTRNAENSKL